MTNRYDASQREPTLGPQQEAISRIGSNLKEAALRHGDAVKEMITEKIRTTLEQTPLQQLGEPQSLIGRIANKLAKDSPKAKEYKDKNPKYHQFQKLSKAIQDLTETLERTENEDIATTEQLSKQMFDKIQEFIGLSEIEETEGSNKELAGLSAARSHFSAACERETSVLLKRLDDRVKTASTGLKAARVENPNIASSASSTLRKVNLQTEKIKSLQKQTYEPSSSALQLSQARHLLTSTETELRDLERNTTEYRAIHHSLEKSRDNLISIEMPIAKGSTPPALTTQEGQFYNNFLKLKKEYEEIRKDTENAETASEFKELRQRSAQLEEDIKVLTKNNPNKKGEGKPTGYQLWESKKNQLVALRGNSEVPTARRRAADQMLLIFSDRWKELESVRVWNDKKLYEACQEGIRHILDPNSHISDPKNRLSAHSKIEAWEQVETNFYDTFEKQLNQLTNQNDKHKFFNIYNYRKDELRQELDLELRSANNDNQIASAWDNYIKGVQGLTKELQEYTRGL